MEFGIVETGSVPEVEATAETVETAEEPGIGLEELSQEVRRVGRELFKTNRAAERSQEMLAAALEEIQQLAAVVAQVPAQSVEAAFEAKAVLCRELLGAVDALEASLAAADETLARLREQAEQPASGLLAHMAGSRRLREALAESVDAMAQWRDGQELLYERLLLALQSAGLRAIEAAGRPFDSALHRAVAVERRSHHPAGTVVGEERRGYLLDGRVLRYAEVTVARDE